MNRKLSWKLVQGMREHALQQGEEITSLMDFISPPVNLFKIINSEPNLYAEGADFGDVFDGCLEYVGPRFLLAYNTKYDQWKHSGKHHPKVRFTIGHELGHYYLDDHRQYLLQGGKSHPCFTEFQSDPYVEQQADCFSAGLLMPSFLLAPHINKQAEPTLDIIKNTAREFEVSITSMMVRWTLLSDFPCATISVSANEINWGWVSEGFKRVKGYRVRRNKKVLSGDTQKFLKKYPNFSNYREGQGLGLAHHWIDFDLSNISVKEFYATIPYINQTLVFITATEDELAEYNYNDLY